MNVEAFSQWLTVYGESWESRDEQRVIELYTPDILYFWTPFEEPKRGREAIADASKEATSKQEDIKFGFEVLTINNNKGWARWWCSFTRVRTGRRVQLDGILMAVFGDDGKCSEFREWWHSDEPFTEWPSHLRHGLGT